MDKKQFQETFKGMAFVEGFDSWNTGGGCIVDIVKLSNGWFLGINDEVICLYSSEDQFWGEADTQLEDSLSIPRRMWEPCANINGRKFYEQELRDLIDDLWAEMPDDRIEAGNWEKAGELAEYEEGLRYILKQKKGA